MIISKKEVRKIERNIYQKAREISGYTQERAAEMLDVCIETLRAYETGKTPPSNERVADMVDVYDTQWLSYKHLRNTDRNNTLPDCELMGVQGAALGLIEEIQDIASEFKNLVRITRDGVIDEHEEEDYSKIIQKAEKSMKAIIEFKYAKKE